MTQADTIKKVIGWKQELKELHHEHLKKTASDFYYASGGKDYQVKKYSDKTANQFNYKYYRIYHF